MNSKSRGKNFLKSLSLNIERDKHLHEVERLITERAPTVICLQEVQQPFAVHLAKKLGYNYQFSLRAHNRARIVGDDNIPEGIFIAWHPSLHLTDTQVHVYSDNLDPSEIGGPNDVRRSLLIATLKGESEVFRFGVSHFTWTPDGSASDEQRTDMSALLSALKEYDDEHGILFCGDFNAPRGGEIFSMMSARYADHIPEYITTTLDQHLHRAAPIHLVVDGMFSTTHYKVTNFEIIDGVSDHVALFAHVSKSVC